MGKNNKPILSVLVDEDKKEKFAELARRSKYSMAWLLNDCIDRMLAANSIDIYRNSASISVESPEPVMSDSSIDEIVKSSIESQLAGETRAYIEELVNASISSRDTSSIGIEDVKESIDTQVEELRSELAEVSEFARNLQGEIVRVKKALGVGVAASTENRKKVTAISDLSPTENPPETKTWVEFFKMVEIEALAATQAQKKENIDTRTEQIEQGLQAARERGLGEWAAKRAGRSFVRVGD